MAKAARRQPFSAAAERFLGLHHRQGSGGAAVAPAPPDDDDLPDLAEADVWYAQSGSERAAADRRGGLEVGGGGAAAPRRVGGLSRAFADGRQVAASAPVEVPAWPSRYAEPEPALYAEQNPAAADADEDGDGWVPPHVYLARRQERASVVEGVGRTLKGRDASRVRDAVWSRTGFDG